MKFINTPEGRTAWIHGMIITAQSRHGEDYPKFHYEMRFLIEWIHEDCRLRWGAKPEEIEKEVNDFLKGQK